ncbi:MAG: FAD-dependent oxidoreductase, partial [Casimicrobiaceae bacterium]
MTSASPPVFAYRTPPELRGAAGHHPVIVVGAGPVGLCAAIDLAQRGIPVVVVDEDETVSVGSRAICYAKRTLEILDRLGCAAPIVRNGVRWSVGKIFHRDALVYQFDLLPESGHCHPAFVNLQQYHVETCLVRHLESLSVADLRWKSQVIGVQTQGQGVSLRVACPDGEYTLSCDWLIAADGARSSVRNLLGLEAAGQVFRDRFLIADIHMRSDFPP